MAFRQRQTPQEVPDDPAQLYRVLQHGGAPKALWLHQGDVLREWHTNFQRSRDVAIELPTGAGKTLVGGLIGEWCRRAKGERVAYLCPTRQLAQQAAADLQSYGIPTVLLTGRVQDWSPADRARYTGARSVAVSVYSHVFNSNPALDDAGVLLLDDAHAAEAYVSGPWSISVPRTSPTFQDLLSLLASALDPLVAQQLAEELPSSNFASGVYLASPIGVASVAAELESALQTAVDTDRLGSEAKYALRLMRGHLDRCLVYFTHRVALIRPFISPTGAHHAFDDPRSRIYMSATLGSGGELERSFGRTRVDRIPLPEGWDRQGTGRRFFVFPELTNDLGTSVPELDDWMVDLTRNLKKAVVLTPERRVANAYEETRVPFGVTVYDARDVEQDLGEFAAADEGVLLLTNRYDGIDLPDEQCRLVVLQNLPAQGNLQERFLYRSLGAMEVLNERLRARLVQGAGRATRNASDYAIVIILGADLVQFCNRPEVQNALHPEVHAEVRFGLDESLGRDSSDLTENISAFLAQTTEWRDAEASIASDRSALERELPPSTAELASSARHEVDAWLKFWQGDAEGALEQARAVLDALTGGRAPQRYAALWNYFAFAWSSDLAEARNDADLRRAADAYLAAARKAARGTQWVSRLASAADIAGNDSEDGDAHPADSCAVEGVRRNFERMGKPSRFDGHVTKVKEDLDSTEADRYESGLVLLGDFLGATESTGNGRADAAPDATWRFDDEIWVTWEAKSESKPSGQLGADHVRQANSHLRFASDKCGEPTPSESFSVVATPQTEIHPAAVAVAEDHVNKVDLDVARDLADRVVRAWRKLRSLAADDAPSYSLVLTTLAAEAALPSQWIPKLQAQPIRTADD